MTCGDNGFAGGAGEEEGHWRARARGRVIDGLCFSAGNRRAMWHQIVRNVTLSVYISSFD